MSQAHEAIGRIKGLDGVRGLAIVLVVVSHAGLGFWASGGRVGVTLFFVLSGYLITRLLINEKASNGSIRLGAFYGRRALRLLPALFVYLAGFALLVWWLRLAVPIMDVTWPPALYLANYVQIVSGDLSAHTHTWSLAVEEHFYILWPLLIAAGAVGRVKPLVIGIALLLGWRVTMGVLNPTWALLSSDTNAYALGFGALIAVLDQRVALPRLPQWTPVVAVVALLALSMVPTDGRIEAYAPVTWLPPFAALIGAVAIIGVIQHDPTYMRSDILAWFGMTSYALYLWHLALIRLPGLSETPLRRLIGVAISIAVAWCSWVIVERPIMQGRLRRGLELGHPASDELRLPDRPPAQTAEV